MVAQRFPGLRRRVLQVPVFPQLDWNMFDACAREAQAGDGWIPAAKVAVIAKEVLRQCDALDGLADGLVSNYMACNRKFDPAVSPKALDAVRCPDGKDTGDTCLSDAQIAAREAVHAAVVPFPLPKGWTSCPAGRRAASRQLEDSQAASTDAATPIAGMLGSLSSRIPSSDAAHVNLAITRSGSRNCRRSLDATNPDLSAFRRRGGKLDFEGQHDRLHGEPALVVRLLQQDGQTMGQRNVDGSCGSTSPSASSTTGTSAATR